MFEGLHELLCSVAIRRYAHEGSFCFMTVKKPAASTPLWGEKPYRSLDYEWKNSTVKKYTKSP